MRKVYISLGANLGEPLVTVQKALLEISILFPIGYRHSRFYETSPVSPIPQMSFINAVCCFETKQSAEEVFCEMQLIEKKLGKVPKGKDEPRFIDLDLLFFGNEYKNLEGLQVPHPRWEKRLFVLAPLSDLVKEIIVPENGKLRSVNISNLLKSFSTSDQKVKVVS